uniref:Uncharacterized protein n=1 Tax=Romanomermis culicivorax TaxID=13658 RepID=A0A915JRK7_ROMCU
MEINFDQWSRRNNAHYIFDIFNTTNTTIDERALETVNRLSPYMQNYFVLDAETLSTIVKSLLSNTFSAIKAKAVDAHSSLIYVNMPEFRCPIPCQYDNQLWQYLFVASLLINVALILLIVPFVFKTERRDKQLYAKQMNLNSASSSSTNGGNLKKMLKKSPKNNRTNDPSK